MKDHGQSYTLWLHTLGTGLWCLLRLRPKLEMVH